MRRSMKRAIFTVSFCMVLWIILTILSFEQGPISIIVKSDQKYEDINALLIDIEKDVVVESAQMRGALDSLKDKALQDEKSSENEPTVLPVLLMACNRITVQRALDQLVRFRGDVNQFPIIVSQDCGHRPTSDAIDLFVKTYPGITHINQPDQSAIVIPQGEKKFRGYYAIARHYKFALRQIFNVLKYDAVIIIEDDLDMSSDIYEYFLATYPLLKSDPKLWCVSAWNDNGKPKVIEIDRPELLHRTDFFPGLGWMTTREIWNELEPKWPKSFFDDWLRHPDQRRDRACIRPEISRTKTFGKIGVSNGWFYDKHLQHMYLNGKHVNFTRLDLNYLKQEQYDRSFLSTAYGAPAVTFDQISKEPIHILVPNAVQIPYSTAAQFKKTAGELGLMIDFKSGVPRTAYKGIVTCFYKGQRIYITPNPSLKSYDPNWS